MNNNKVTNVLFIDDDTVNAKVAKSAVVGLSEIKLVCVESGYTALEAIKLKHFDIIFVKHDMAYMDGLRTIRSIRKILPFDSGSKFIVCLEAITSENVESYISSGVFDFIKTPVFDKQLRSVTENTIKNMNLPDLKSYKDYHIRCTMLPRPSKTTGYTTTLDATILNEIESILNENL